MRTLVIGDIHGALLSLKDVLKKCNYNPEEDKLIFLGDYVDGWGESALVVDYLIQLKEENENIVFIRGNHDVWCQNWLTTGVNPIIWEMNGGKTTTESYLNAMLIGNKKHIAFFYNMVNWYIDDENRIFIHGGWDYKSAPFPAGAAYPVNAGAGAKECHWDRSLLKNAAAMEVFNKKGISDYNKKLKAELDRFKEVYIGHTATTHHNVENFHNLWNIDAGCGWHGRLAIMDIDTKEVWYSKKSKEYYPDEKGR